MAVRGSEAKEIIKNKILETFEGSFPYDKEIRIPIEENGEIVQIKVTLTAAKVNVGVGADVAVPGAAVQSMPGTQATPSAEITPEEKKNVTNLIETLGL